MTEPARKPKAFRNCLFKSLLAMMIGIALFGPDAQASGGGQEDAKPSESAEPKEPQIPETVIEPDSIALTVVLPKSGAIRQMVFYVWLEASSVADRAVIEQAEPKLLNAFLRDLQRIMYRDTQNRYEKLEAGKRGFVYNGPELIAPPPPKTPEELEAEKEALEAAKEKGEEIKSEPPFSPFRPTTNRYFAALQSRLLATARGIVPPESIRSVQVRKFYDNWPGDKKPGR
ncbi:hypothetical protein ABIE64_001060 [Thalassospira sp. MBR-102]|jgi:hypothetical protein|uniref:Uncharacterized protein n=1 Tax=Thalassospira xiamenensis TaxID=220697 RepID=A0ABR5Y737_9PROT|nr:MULTISPECIES: hypothetical protein [Thalassospira]KZD06559.1 hypothetical protein AUP40_09715 [Thalassospira xiamenensis]KZD10846.1 hypothetical protein AUP45_09720 [Thalassospira xiamenensis]MAB33429.1 hypothetical protein [Thalassospira sp.]MBL4841637.1 hypothetical protein [Thalassospira sp.]MCD1592751.1 hypothetical protein [Thalassospira xiamenensis]|tara:strand:- start:2908 stop:3594 length:687 start_codon:yes stop_codon:yes gene_type:complete